MDSKFDAVPIDSDTQILLQQQTKYGEHDVLYQKWHWDGVTAESLVFIEDELEGSDEKLLRDIKLSALVDKDSQLTLSRKGNGFVFVNFNFATN